MKRTLLNISFCLIVVLLGLFFKIGWAVELLLNPDKRFQDWHYNMRTVPRPDNDIVIIDCAKLNSFEVKSCINQLLNAKPAIIGIVDESLAVKLLEDSQKIHSNHSPILYNQQKSSSYLYTVGVNNIVRAYYPIISEEPSFPIQIIEKANPDLFESLIKRGNEKETIYYYGNVFHDFYSEVKPAFNVFRAEQVSRFTILEMEEYIQGKVVLIGEIKKGAGKMVLASNYQTPYLEGWLGSMSPVVICANIVSMSLNRKHISNAHVAHYLILASVLFFLHVSLFSRIGKNWFLILVSLILYLEIYLFGYVEIYVFAQYDFSIDIKYFLLPQIIAPIVVLLKPNKRNIQTSF